MVRNTVTQSPAVEAKGLIEFVLARIAEAEALATEANESKGSMVQGWWAFDPDLGDGYLWRSYQPEFRDREQQTGMPARVLAECATKRRLVEFCAVDVDSGTESWDAGVYARRILGELAQLDADHPDYQQEWAPDVR